MVDTRNGAASFLHGLSDLWLRFFKDKKTLEALYEGTEVVAGQAYLELMTTVLNLSIRETTIYSKDLFKLLLIREDEITFDLDTGHYVYVFPDNTKGMTFLHNRAFAHTAALEEYIDFEINNAGTDDELRFYHDPFDWDGAGNAIPLFPTRTVDVLQADGVTITPTKQMSLWAINARRDRFDLYLTYGYLLDRFEPSSEAYRSLLQGITQYFVLGPTVDYITSALNVIAGLPLIRNDEEYLLRVDTTDPDSTVIVTNLETYSFHPEIPLRADILDTTNWADNVGAAAALQFKLLENLTLVFVVKDNITDPAWWYDIIIPDNLLPLEPRARRVLKPDLIDNSINNLPDLVNIGDPGFFIGADDDGFVPSTRDALRHRFSYVTFERFLRHHVFLVDPDTHTFTNGLLPFPRSERDFLDIIRAGSSAYTFLYIAPELHFEDTFYVAGDEMLVTAGLAIAEESIGVVDSEMTIGEYSWEIGDFFRLTPGSLTVYNESTDTPDPALGDTNVVIAGNDPTHLGGAHDSGATGDFSFDPGLGLSVMRVAVLDFFSIDAVGMYIYRESLDVFYEITAVENYGGLSELQFSSTAINVGSGENWELWDTGTKAQFIDWPVQIKITP